MKTVLKILKWLFIGLAGIILIGFLYVYYIILARPSEIADVKDRNDNEWHTVLLGGETTCSDGSEYLIYTRRGKSDNLIIHFSGGGACWDDPTCYAPITLSSILFEGDLKELKSFYFANIIKIPPKLLKGIFEDINSNPFKEWNVVFIPYCTGDLHIGNVANTYVMNEEEFQIHHNGRKNTLAALKWILSNFQYQAKVLVSGESAGAYASAFWAPYIAGKYENSKIYQLSDGALLTSERWPEILDTVWAAESSSFLNFEIGKDIFENALLNRTESSNKPIRHLHSNTLYDLILPKFSAALNHSSTANNEFIDNWSADMLFSMKKLANSDLDYQYFISNCDYDSIMHATPHTLVGNKNFNICESDQISYDQWLQRNVIGDETFSVGSEFINLMDDY